MMKTEWNGQSQSEETSHMKRWRQIIPDSTKLEWGKELGIFEEQKGDQCG